MSSTQPDHTTQRRLCLTQFLFPLPLGLHPRYCKNSSAQVTLKHDMPAAEPQTKKAPRHNQRQRRSAFNRQYWERRKQCTQFAERVRGLVTLSVSRESDLRGSELGRANAKRLAIDALWRVKRHLGATHGELAKIFLQPVRTTEDWLAGSISHGNAVLVLLIAGFILGSRRQAPQDGEEPEATPQQVVEEEKSGVDNSGDETGGR